MLKLVMKDLLIIVSQADIFSSFIFSKHKEKHKNVIAIVFDVVHER